MSEKIIANFLKQLRKTSGLSANEVVTLLKEYEIDISAKTLYGYESGLSMLNADAFVALCRIYKCDNSMDIFGTPSINSYEQEIIEKYRELDFHGKDMVDTVLEKEYIRCVSTSSNKIQPFTKPELAAAHERTDIEVTEDMRKHDDDIMMDDSEWE